MSDEDPPLLSGLKRTLREPHDHSVEPDHSHGLRFLARPAPRPRGRPDGFERDPCLLAQGGEVEVDALTCH
jgi:hypothetical protein